MSGYNDEREESIRALEETINLPNVKTVRPGSPAERLCKRLISVVMCTFAIDQKHAIVTRAFCDYEERTKIKPSQLAKKMSIDNKTVSEILKKLKAGGYILETSFAESFSKRAKSGGKLKTVRYHIDYSYFINMVRYRLHEIIVRLSKKQEENDLQHSIGSFVCINEQCKEYMNSFNTLDLMSKANSGNQEIDKKTGKLVFVCDMCHEQLIDESEKFKDETTNNLDIKRAFNQQIMPLTKLLNEVELAIKNERASMLNEQRRAEEEKEMIESGYGQLTYKAANLNFGKKKRGKRGANHNKEESERTLEHLSRLGGRRRKIDTTKFLFKPEDIEETSNKDKRSNSNNSSASDTTVENKEDDNDIDMDSSSDELDDIDILQENWLDAQRNMSNMRNFNKNSIEMKQAISKNFEKMKKDGENHFKTLNRSKLKHDNNRNSNSNANNDDTGNSNAFWDDIKQFDTSNIMLKVNGNDVSLKMILENSDLYENKMTEQEFIDYDNTIVELGLTSIE